MKFESRQFFVSLISPVPKKWSGIKQSQHLTTSGKCSVVTSVNHTSTRSKRNSHSPCSRCEHGVNKSELSFDFRWFYLNGTTPHLATRIHGVHPVREFKSQRADKAIQVPKRGQCNSNPKARTRQS